MTQMSPGSGEAGLGAALQDKAARVRWGCPAPFSTCAAPPEWPQRVVDALANCVAIGKPFLSHHLKSCSSVCAWGLESSASMALLNFCTYT
eukprot:1143760-Pelagomonas_calceolata.AAC.1